jgi:hypothetical protein
MILIRSQLDPADLHVVSVFFNHNRRQSPVENFQRFRAHMQALGVTFWAVELVQGDLPFEVTSAERERDVQLRTRSEFFQKENLADIGFRHVVRMRPDAKYLALADADIQFFNPAVAQQTIEMLNRFAVGQMWAMACDLGPDGHPLVYPGPDGAQVSRSFGYCYVNGVEPTSVTKRYGYEWHPGYAWGFRRDVWEALGGLYEHSIVGSADLHMAWAFTGKIGWGVDANATPAFQADLRTWCERAAKVVGGNVGYVDGLVHHHWHGRKVDRRYVARWAALVDNQFDPALDLTRDVHGLLHLTGRNPQLQRDLRAYMRGRNEDANTVA